MTGDGDGDGDDDGDGDGGTGGEAPILPDPPEVIAVSPGEEETSVEPDAEVEITFSETLDEATVTPETVQGSASPAPAPHSGGSSPNSVPTGISIASNGSARTTS